MTLNPECQERAQNELDTIVGTGRLPDLSDRDSLPYVEALVQETLRIYPAVPLGVPHRSIEDDVYNGMFIPKHSMVISNIRAMTWDERIYSEPKRFNPSRYLPKPEGNNEPYPVSAFGFGRRVCPGRHLASGSVWLAIASMLSTFKISKAIDQNGVEITPKEEFTSGISSHPVPFECRIEPRSAAARNLIMQAQAWDSY